VIPSVTASSEGYVADSATPVKDGRGRHQAQGGERSSSSGSTIASAVSGSRDRGCNDHRILRRVPTDGRHPGSSRSAGFHETATTVVLAVYRILRPVQSTQKVAPRPGSSSEEARRGEG